MNKPAYVRLFRKCALVSIVFFVAFVAITAYRIVQFGNIEAQGSADAAIVLGAAAWGTKPSPVYRERINEAVRLYKEGRIKSMIFTGGTREYGFPTEAEVAMHFAIQHGIPVESILVDKASHTTAENLVHAKELMAAAGIHSTFMVSDPLHMMRVIAIAKDLEMDAKPAPTESSRIQSWGNRAKFLWRETWLYMEHMLVGELAKLETIV